MPDFEVVVTDDGSRTLRIISTGTTWHSESGALSESQTVFLKNGNVEHRLNTMKDVSVLEIGFGTGLNFWLTASQAISEKAKLHYVSIEPNMLSEDLIANLKHGELPACQPAADIFISKIFLERNSQFQAQCVHLQIFKSIDSIENTPGLFDCIYHDPFAPGIAPELWTNDCFQELFKYLKPAGRLVTYCVQSKIQRILAQVGFVVSKTPGPIGGKREVLIAEKP